MGGKDPACIPEGPAALVCPGVGVRLSGWEAPFYHAYRGTLSPLLEAGSERCGCDLTNALSSGRVDALDERARQIFTFAFSAGAADVALAHVSPEAAAGYSFGVYAALYAARVIDLYQGFGIVDAAYDLMARAAAGRDAGMGVVVGLDASELRLISEREALGTVVRTNSNHRLCHIFSGSGDQLDRFLSCAAEAGAFRSERLSVKIPYHHPGLLGTAKGLLRPRLEPTAWSPAAFPIVSSVDGALLTDPEALADFLAVHLSTPISWERVMTGLHDLGVTVLLECGPGISLTQNGRFLPYDDMTYLNVKRAARCVRD